MMGGLECPPLNRGDIRGDVTTTRRCSVCITKTVR